MVLQGGAGRHGRVWIHRLLVFVLPDGDCVLPDGGCVFPAGVLLSGGTRRHITSRPQARARTSLLSAAGSLASESKLQGEIDRCDYSYYQLFRCSFRVCFYREVCRLKR